MLVAAVVLILTASTACTSPPTPPLSLDSVRNASYYVDPQALGWVDLRDGLYVDRQPPGPDVTVKLVEPIAFGDLNGDGLQDAAVLLVATWGGTGHFYSLNVLVDNEGIPTFAGSAELGDRVKVLSLSIADGVITLDLMTHGPGDPMCCPNKRETQSYRLVAGSLIPA